MTSKDYAVTGTIVPLADGTRMRVSSSTYTTVLNSYPKGAVVTVDLVREFTATDLSKYFKAGDKWGRVVAVDGLPPKKLDGSPVTGEAWMAITYLGGPICRPNYTVNSDVPTEPAEPLEIESAVLTLKYSDGRTEAVPLAVVK